MTRKSSFPYRFHDYVDADDLFVVALRDVKEVKGWERRRNRDKSRIKWLFLIPVRTPVSRY